MIDLAIDDAGGITVIAAAGRLDALASPRLEGAIKQALEGGQVHLVADLGEVSYISSACLRVLLLGARQTREQGGDLKLCCLSARLEQVFSLAGFDVVFELYPSRAEALAAFKTSPHGGARPCASG